MNNTADRIYRKVSIEDVFMVYRLYCEIEKCDRLFKFTRKYQSSKNNS